MFQNQIKVAVSLCFFLFLFSCTSTNMGNNIPVSAAKDSAYFPVLSKYTKSDSIYSHLQKVLDVSAVQFSEEMKNAYLNRLARIRQANPLMPEANIVGSNVNSFLALDFENGGPKTGFLVSVYTPDSAFQELENKNLWNIRFGNAPLSKIQKLSDKDTLDAFFPFVNKWTSEYLMIFEKSNSASSSTENQLILSSSLVSAAFQW